MEQEQRSSGSWQWIVLAVIVLLAGGGFAYQFSLSQARKRASHNNTVCMSNLSQLCKAISMYQDIYGTVPVSSATCFQA